MALSQATHCHTSRGKFEITEAIKQYVEEKLTKLERLHIPIQKVHCIYEIDKYHHVVTILLFASSHIRIRAKGSTKDMYASIDAAIAIVQAKLRKYHELMKSHHLKAPASLTSTPHQEDFDIQEINHAIEEQTITEQKQALLPPISYHSKRTLSTLLKEEAIMKMELSEDECLVYIDEITHKLCAIYKRGDGTYGIHEVLKKSD